MNTTIATGQNYFDDEDFPLTVLRTQSLPDKSPSHPHDLTEIEHRHDFAELVIITAGSGTHQLEGNDFPVIAGDVFLLQGMQRHFFHERVNLEMINIMYDPEKLMLPESGLRSMPGYCAIFLLEPTTRRRHKFKSRLHLKRIQLAHVEQLASEMENEKQNDGPGKQVVLLARLLDLFVYLSRLYVNSTDTRAGELLRVGKAIGALEQNYTYPWTLPELLKISNMSRSTLLRVFRKATGSTPIEYLSKLRIQRAMEQIRSSNRSITEIAMDTGFNDSNYFARQFRKATGVSPSDYRKQIKLS